jgi:glucose-6-phosphate isomerase
MRSQGLDPARHMVTVTAKGSPGDDPDRPMLQSFHMFDFIGGRYSVTSAVGGVPLSLYLGYERFEEFLQGANEMDCHARSAPVLENLPMLAALLSVWNTTYLGYPQQAIIPYASPLAKLAPHIQQLNMESNGKAVDLQGRRLPEPAGVIIFGEPGTNAQHSFFQLAHQGKPFPIDFIGVRNPQYPQYQSLSKGVTNHQELWANMIAQAKALAVGEKSPEAARHFDGNRPSSTIVLDDLGPRNIGRLLSFYEARTVYEGFIWGVNSFDQFGVQLGKTVASDLRHRMADRNQDKSVQFTDMDPISRFYLEMLMGTN